MKQKAALYAAQQLFGPSAFALRRSVNGVQKCFVGFWSTVGGKQSFVVAGGGLSFKHAVRSALAARKRLRRRRVAKYALAALACLAALAWLSWSLA